MLRRLAFNLKLWLFYVVMTKRKKTNYKFEPKSSKKHTESSQKYGPHSKNYIARSQENVSSLLFGKHAVLAALRNPKRHILHLLLTHKNYIEMRIELEKAIKEGKHDNLKISHVNKKELETNLPDGSVHQGIALQTKLIEKTSLEDIINQTRGSPKELIVIIDQATDPHNIGSILRSASAFGAAAVVIQDRNAPGITGTLAKAASGALERIPLIFSKNLARVLDKLKVAEFWCIGLDGLASETLSNKNLNGRIALVLGAEGTGLRRLTREKCDLLVKIPINDNVESLNLSIATAIALYELTRN